MNSDEVIDLAKIMKRRACEIRMAFISTQIEE